MSEDRGELSRSDGIAPGADPAPAAAAPDALPAAARRVQAALRAVGLAPEVREMPGSTRTAEEAATACGCPLGAIVKSLVFRTEDGAGLLILVSGSNRVHEKRLGKRLGTRLMRADAALVREATGYAIGGIPPLGHAAPLRTVMDADLLGFETVWAAAGTPFAVFPAVPGELARVTGAEIVEIG